MSVTRIYHIYNQPGHRIRDSFFPSITYHFERPYNPELNPDVKPYIATLVIRRADLTGTHEYTEVIVTCDTLRHCEREILGQESDGIFENTRTWYVIDVTDKKRPLELVSVGKYIEWHRDALNNWLDQEAI